MNKLDLAEIDCKKALSLAANQANSHYIQGFLDFVKGKPKKALASFREAEKQSSSQNIAVIAVEAVTSYELGYAEQSIQIWRHISKKQAKHDDINWLRAEYAWPESILKTAQALISQKKA